MCPPKPSEGGKERYDAHRRSTRCVTAGLLAASATLAAQRGPSPVTTHLDAEVIALACSPKLIFEAPSPRCSSRADSIRSLVICTGPATSSRSTAGRTTASKSARNTSSAGCSRHAARACRARSQPRFETTGWVKVYAVDKTMSLVTVEHACDTMNVGDYLEPFSITQPPIPDANPPKPQRENYGHILIGADRRTMFAKNDFFVGRSRQRPWRHPRRALHRLPRQAEDGAGQRVVG